MSRKLQKLLALLLSVLTVVSLLGLNALAEEETTYELGDYYTNKNTNVKLPALDEDYMWSGPVEQRIMRCTLTEHTHTVDECGEEVSTYDAETNGYDYTYTNVLYYYQDSEPSCNNWKHTWISDHNASCYKRTYVTKDEAYNSDGSLKSGITKLNDVHYYRWKCGKTAHTHTDGTCYATTYLWTVVRAAYTANNHIGIGFTVAGVSDPSVIVQYADGSTETLTSTGADSTGEWFFSDFEHDAYISSATDLNSNRIEALCITYTYNGASYYSVVSGWDALLAGHKSCDGGKGLHFAITVVPHKYYYKVVYNYYSGSSLVYSDSGARVVTTEDVLLTLAPDTQRTYRGSTYYLASTEETYQNVSLADSADDATKYVTVTLNYRTNVSTHDYALTYDGNGGVLADASASYNDTESISGIAAETRRFNVDENTFLRSGWHFTGWNTEANGSGTSYAAGDTLTLPEGTSSAVTLYAQWAEGNPTPTPTPAPTATPAPSLKPTPSETPTPTPTATPSQYTLGDYFVSGTASAELPALDSIYMWSGPIDTSTTTCGLTEHTHSKDSCTYKTASATDYDFLETETKYYTKESEPSCGIWWHTVLWHSDSCYKRTYHTYDFAHDKNGNLINGFYEESNTTYYKWTCGKVDHTHTEACYAPHYTWQVVYASYTVDAHVGVTFTDSSATDRSVTVTYADGSTQTLTTHDVEAGTGAAEEWYFSGFDREAYISTSGDTNANRVTKVTVSCTLNGKNSTYTVDSWEELLAARELCGNRNAGGLHLTVNAQPDKYYYKVSYNYYRDGRLVATDTEPRYTTTEELTATVTPDAARTYKGTTYNLASPESAYKNVDITASVNDPTKTVVLSIDYIYGNGLYDYALTYDGNGGALESGATTCADAENTVSDTALSKTFTLDQNAFTREGYTFTGWNTAADGNGTSYAAGETLTALAKAPSVTLYAMWESNEPEPSQSADPEPSQSADPVPEPSQSSDPEPSQSSDPEPSQSSDPEPSQSADPVPEPSQSSDPEPSQSSDPEPSQSAQPVPEPSQSADLTPIAGKEVKPDCFDPRDPSVDEATQEEEAVSDELSEENLISGEEELISGEESAEEDAQDDVPKTGDFTGTAMLWCMLGMLAVIALGAGIVLRKHS